MGGIISAPRLTDEYLRGQLTLILKYGSVSAAAKATDRPRETLQHYMKLIRQRFPEVMEALDTLTVSRLTKLNTTVVEKPRIRVKAASSRDADPLEIRRVRDKANEYAARVRELETRLIETEDAYNRLCRLSQTKIEIASWPQAPAIHTGTTLLPVLFTSDFQLGEVINPDELDGMNAYNKDIFAERYQKMIDKTINLLKYNTGAANFAGIIYARGGDALSGGIHLDLAETDDLSSVPAVKWLLQHEREGIRRLNDAFGRTHVVSIPGNHGRTNIKPRSKGYVEHNYETLLAWWLQMSFENNPQITFDTPKSGDAYFDVLGWKFLMSHGDRMGSRGNGGFIGPAATIARGHKKLYDTWTQSGLRVDRILTGHLHTSLALELGYSNGALAGYSEYARDLRCYPDAPKQWLLAVHKEHGVTHQFELKLGNMPKRIAADAWSA